MTSPVHTHRKRVSSSLADLRASRYIKTTPRKYQVRAARKLFKKKSFALVMDPGTGKTLVALWYASKKYYFGKIKTVLIIGPKVSESVWAYQIKEHIKLSTKRFKWGKPPAKNALTFYFLTYQSAVNRRHEIQDFSPDLIIVDESHGLKNPNSKQSKAIGQVDAEYKIMLTGTPVDDNPVDFWAQWRFCRPQLFGTDWKWFRENWCKKQEVYSRGRPIPYVFKYPIHPATEVKFLERMNPYVFTAKNEELPRLNTIPHVINLNPHTMLLYQDLQEESIAEIEDKAMVGDSAFSLIVRLQQLSSGIFVDEDDEHHFIDDSKINEVKSMIELHDEPAVVFCKFLDDIHRLDDALKGRTVRQIRGARKDSTRGKWDVMLVQTQSGGVSIDLTRARHMYFISLPFSYIQYYQAVRRSYRPPQKRPVSVWIIEAHSTIDMAIRSVIQRKSSVTAAILRSLK